MDTITIMLPVSAEVIEQAEPELLRQELGKMAYDSAVRLIEERNANAQS